MKDELEEALGCEFDKLDAPRGFTDRVMRRVAERERQRRMRVEPWQMAIAAGLLVCVSAMGYREHERREAEEARAQFAVAMRVTNRSLAAVDRGLARGLAGRDRDSDESTGAMR
jgi:hypothetical protein